MLQVQESNYKFVALGSMLNNFHRVNRQRNSQLADSKLGGNIGLVTRFS